jgi:hypothetical protein
VEGDEAQDDPFGVQLEWPEEQLAEPYEPPARESAPAPAPPPATSFAPPGAVPMAPTPVRAAPASPDPVGRDAVAADPRSEGASPASDEVQLVLGKVVARVDALTAATTTFRNLVSDRVSEYTERVVQVVSGTVADIDEQRRLSERDMTQLRSGMARANAAIDRLTASVDTLAAEIDRVAGELGSQLDRVTDEVQTLRRRTAVRSRSVADAEDDVPPSPRRPVRKRS